MPREKIDQLGITGDVALRRKGGALSVEAKSVSVDGDFLQAKAFKVVFRVCTRYVYGCMDFFPFLFLF